MLILSKTWSIPLMDRSWLRGSHDGTVVLWEPLKQSDIYWVEQMTQDEAGNWLPPEDVIEQIEADYKAMSEAKREVFFASDPPDLGLYEASLPDWYSGEILEFYQDQYLDDLRAGKFTYGVAEWDECSHQVRECSQNGLECKIARTCSNGTRHRYNFTTGVMTSEFDDQLGTVISPLRYDAVAGTWKTYEYVEFIPPDESAQAADTPGSTTGVVSGQAFWKDTDTPVEGVQLLFGEGIATFGEGITTNAQGNYSEDVNPGSFSITLNWEFAGQSDVPCSNLDFTILGEWNVFPMILAQYRRISSYCFWP